MPRIRIQDIRRKELIEATIQSIYKKGFTDLTVGMISKEAGVSNGNIHYYFGSKDELLEETMRFLLSKLRSVSIRKLATAKTPHERLEAVVHCNFDPEFFQPETVAAWIQFWAQAPYYQRLHRLEKISIARVQSNLRHALKQIVPMENVDIAAKMIQAVIDGIWLHSAHTTGGLAPKLANQMAREGVEGILRVYAA